MSLNNVCRLCFSSINAEHVNLFSDIGIQLNISDIISEHFKCNVNKSIKSILVPIVYYIRFDLFIVSLFLLNIRSVKLIICQMLCVMNAGQQLIHSISYFESLSQQQRRSYVQSLKSKKM